MKAQRRLWLAVLSIGVLVAAALPIQSASATSAYDNTVRTVDSLEVNSGDICTSPTGQYPGVKDYSMTWKTTVRNEIVDRVTNSSWQSYYLNDWDNRSKWGVSVSKDVGDAGWDLVTVWYTTQTNITGTFLASGGYHYYWYSNPTASQIRYLTFYPRSHGVSGANPCDSNLRLMSRGSVSATTTSVTTANVISDNPTYSGGDWDNYIFLSTPAPNYPSGYAGVAIPAVYTPPLAKYVAMGDSFSSGEGNPLFEDETDVDGVNECHRSPQAYPRLLQNDTSLNLGQAAFVACSGATTANVKGLTLNDGQWNEPPQSDALTADTEFVTLTIGGNDAGFAHVIKQCADPDAEPTEQDMGVKCENARAEVWQYLNADGLFEDVGTTLLRIDSITNSQAAVWVGGYANPFPVDNYTYCYWGLDYMNNVVWPPGIPTRGVTSLERADFDAMVTEINTQIEEAVDLFPQMEFVDVQDYFEGHDACSGTPWFNAISYPDDKEYSYHPNTLGQQKYYEKFAEAMIQ